MKFENDGINTLFLMPSEIVKHLKKMTASEIKVATYIFAKGLSVENEAEIAEATGIPEAKVSEAIGFLRGAGIIKLCDRAEQPSAQVSVVSDASLSERNVSYSSGELADAMEGNEDFASLIDFASKKLGKILTPAEQSNLFILVDMLSLPCDLIMAIIEYCIARGKKSVKYIERTAEKLSEEGIDTYKKFEKYLRSKEKQEQFEEKIKKIIGATERALTKGERTIIEGFLKDGVDTELIAAAYEKTINNISKPSLSYMSKIVDNWKSKGIKTVADLDGMKPYDAGKYKGEGYFNLDDFAEKPDDDFEE